ncbi:MAG: universal stress protein [Myxococcota bacterium]
MKQVLAALDFSDNSRAALEYARALGGRLGWTINLLHAFEELGGEGWRVLLQTPEALEKSLYEEAHGKLEELRGEVEEDSDEGASKITVVTGSPVEESIRVALRDRDEMIVCGATGTTLVEEFFFGSTAQALVQASPLPVLVVPRGTQASAPEVILAPVNFDEVSRESLKIAASWAEVFDAKLVVMHAAVLPTSSHDPFIGALAPSIEDYSEALKERLTRLVDQVGVGAHVSETRLKFSSPGQAIVGEAEDMGASLICMGTNGHTGLQRLLHGNTAVRVLRRAPCPVMVYRQEVEGR